MDLETFAEMQRTRVKAMSIETVRRRQLAVKSFELTDIAEIPATSWRDSKGTAADPIRAAYRRLGMVYD